MPPPSHPLPEDLGSSDVGVVAAVGAYVAVCLVAIAISASLALGGSTATIVGTVSTVATFGVVVGAILASRIDGLAARLGRRRRSLALLGVPPLGFAVATVLAVAAPAIGPATAVVLGFGALVTGVASLSFASMARERYARAMTPDEPLLTVAWVDPVQVYGLIAIGLAAIVGSLSLVVLAGLEWLRIGALSALFVGGVFVFAGLAQHVQFATDGRRSFRFLPDETGRKIFGSRYSGTVSADFGSRPELEVYENGLIAPGSGSTGRHFVPWGDVADVRLTPSTLVVERRDGGRFRCYRSAMNDPESVVETLEGHVVTDHDGSPGPVDQRSTESV